MAIKKYFWALFLVSNIFLSCKEIGEKEIQSRTPTSENTISGWVVGISDGDSFKLKLEDNEIIRVRLAYVDCPERGQDFYQKAKQFSSRQIFKKSIQVEVTDTDRYGRKVGIVYYDDKILNEELLKNGFAWHYTQYSDSAVLQELENQARITKKGLWIMTNPIAPWTYRKKQRN
ncbi:MAG: thermonuclease family protein [Flavobacteriaceae bacterium]|nr:thermonuclease family protein [Flavobacteriaceae bacterium]